VVIKPAGVTHATAFGGDGAVTIQIELSAEDEARAEAGGYRLGWWRWSHAGEATRPMLELARRIRDVDGSEPTLDDLIIETLATLTPSEPCPRGPAPRWLVAARDVLVSESVTIRSLAAQAGVHPIHLAREFRRRFGLAPTGFRRRMRIRRAAALLARSPEPLAAIALEAGFADQSHMNRELRRAAGVTPAGMRRLARV
jgi:AraC family transcriptional regulator